MALLDQFMAMNFSVLKKMVRMQTLRRYHKLLFYRLYKWHYNMHGDYDEPEFTAVCYISILTILNISSALFFFDKLFGIDIMNVLFPNKFLKGLYSMGIFLFNYFSLYYKKKHKKVIMEQNELNKVQQKRENIIITIYIISTPIIFFLSIVCPPLVL